MDFFLCNCPHWQSRRTLSELWHFLWLPRDTNSSKSLPVDFPFSFCQLFNCISTLSIVCCWNVATSCFHFLSYLFFPLFSPLHLIYFSFVLYMFFAHYCFLWLLKLTCVCVCEWMADICGWTKLLASRCLFGFYRPKGKCHKIHKGVGAMEENVPQCCSTTGF